MIKKPRFTLLFIIFLLYICRMFEETTPHMFLINIRGQFFILAKNVLIFYFASSLLNIDTDSLIYEY